MGLRIDKMNKTCNLINSSEELTLRFIDTNVRIPRTKSTLRVIKNRSVDVIEGVTIWTDIRKEGK